jgi:type I restriction enzyme S subunit
MKPYPKYHPTDIEWLGKIPTHWEVRRLKVVFKIVKDIVGELGHEVLSVTQKGIKKKDLTTNDGQMSMDYSKYQRVRQGQFVMNHMDLLTGYVDISKYDGVTSPDYRVFEETLMSVVPRYYLYLFQICYNLKIFYGLGSGVSIFGRWRLPSDEFLNFPIPFPPMLEQKAMAAFLDEKTKQIDTLIEKKQRMIELLREERQAVINEAVTKGINPKAKLRDSSIEWLGEIPEHWEVKKVKYISGLRSGESITSDSIKDEGEYPVYGGNGLRGYTDSYTHDGNFVLIGRQGALCGNINVAKGKFFGSEHAVIATPKVKYNLTWFEELLRTMNLNQYSQSAAQPGLSVERIQNLEIPVPEIEEQDQLAELIEKTRSNSEELSRSFEEEIELLQEYRTALITEVVTGKVCVV